MTATITRAQAREIDQRAIREFGVAGLTLMENAGRGATDVLQQLGIEGSVTIFCGKGNNGGDGFVIARHLQLRGISVRVVLCTDANRFAGDALVNYRIIRHCEIPIIDYSVQSDLFESIKPRDWIVDAILGTGVTGSPRSPLDDIITAINGHPARCFAIDLPSGLDCDTGVANPPTIRATATCTFVAYKPGLICPSARPFVGQISVADIGAPQKLIDQYLVSE